MMSARSCGPATPLDLVAPGIALAGAARNASSVLSFQTVPTRATALEWRNQATEPAVRGRRRREFAHGHLVLVWPEITLNATRLVLPCVSYALLWP